MDFEWLEPTPKRAGPDKAVEMRSGELAARAALLARLGYSREDATARLQARVGWEYERLGAAKVAKKVEAIVKQAFEHQGAGQKAGPASKKKVAKARR